MTRSLYSDGVANATEYARLSAGFGLSGTMWFKLWFRPIEVGRVHTLMSEWREDVDRRRFRWYVDTNGDFVFQSSADGFAGSVVTTTWAAPSQFQLNVTTFWLLTLDGSNKPRLYTGAPGGSLVDLGAGTDGTHADWNLVAAAQFSVGNQQDPKLGTRNFRGYIDHAAIGGGVLNASERDEKFKNRARAGEGATVAYRFDNGNGSTFADRSLGTVQNLFYTLENGLFSDAHFVLPRVDLDEMVASVAGAGFSLFADDSDSGLGAGVHCGETPADLPAWNGTDEFAMGTWLRPSELSRIHTLFAKWREDDNNREFRFFMNAAGDLVLETSSNGVAVASTTWSYTPTLDAWIWVGLYSPPASLTAEVFVGSGSLGSQAIGSIFNGTARLCIGNQQGPGAIPSEGARNFRGYMNHARWSDDAANIDASTLETWRLQIAQRGDPGAAADVGIYRFFGDLVSEDTNNVTDMELISRGALFAGTNYILDGAVEVDLTPFTGAAEVEPPDPRADVALDWILFGSADVVIEDDDIKADKGLRTAVLLSLFTDRRAEPDDPDPAGDGDRRGYWADEFAEVEGDRYGSRLWLLDRSKATAQALVDARIYDLEALEWLLEDGVAEDVEAVVTFEAGRMLHAITISRPLKDPVTFRFSHVWDAERDLLIGA